MFALLDRLNKSQIETVKFYECLNSNTTSCAAINTAGITKFKALSMFVNAIRSSVLSKPESIMTCDN